MTLIMPRLMKGALEKRTRDEPDEEGVHEDHEHKHAAAADDIRKRQRLRQRIAGPQLGLALLQLGLGRRFDARQRVGVDLGVGHGGVRAGSRASAAPAV